MHELLEIISKDVLDAALKELNLIYPNPKHDIEVVIKDYYFKLKKYKQKQLLKAIEKYNSSDNKLFPTILELKYYYNQVLRQEKFFKDHVERQEPIPEITPEQLENRKRIWKEKRQKIIERGKV